MCNLRSGPHVLGWVLTILANNWGHLSTIVNFLWLFLCLINFSRPLNYSEDFSPTIGWKLCLQSTDLSIINWLDIVCKMIETPQMMWFERLTIRGFLLVRSSGQSRHFSRSITTEKSFLSLFFSNLSHFFKETFLFVFWWFYGGLAPPSPFPDFSDQLW